MVRKWRQRPKWLKKVYTTSEPRLSETPPPSLKVYLGFGDTIGWDELLLITEISKDEPHLLYLSPARRRQLEKERFITQAKSWVALVDQDNLLVSPLKADATVHWRDLAGGENPILTQMRECNSTGGTVTWKELLAALDSD